MSADGAASSYPSLLRIGGMFATNVFQECLLNRVDRLYRCFGPDPFHDYDFMTDGAFAGNDGARPKGGNQLRLPCWRDRHESRSPHQTMDEERWHPSATEY